jgi:hypothetical protein
VEIRPPQVDLEVFCHTPDEVVTRERGIGIVAQALKEGRRIWTPGRLKCSPPGRCTLPVLYSLYKPDLWAGPESQRALVELESCDSSAIPRDVLG